MEDFARECKIRDCFRDNLNELRPNERLVATEPTYRRTKVRADLRTVDHLGVLREWEFKLHACYSALGQVLTYVSHARVEKNFERNIRGVIAAFSFREDLEQTVRVMNLGIELVTIPAWMAKGGLSLKQSPAEFIHIPNAEGGLSA